jgi:teichuronic acid biosynthesis glycosyltransferase TuaG
MGHSRETTSLSALADHPSRFIDGLVSVVTPAHNAEAYLATMIESVVAQTHSDWELIVVDDASTDATPEIVEAYADSDSRIRLVRLAERSGPAMARNTALDRARGRFIAFLDSDDWWRPEKLARHMAFMKQTGAPLSYSASRWTDRSGRPRAAPIRVPSAVGYAGLIGNNVILTSSAMVDRSLTGAFQMPDVKHEDFATWLAILRGGGVARGLQADLTFYRLVPGSRSDSKWRSALWVWRVYRDVERLSLPVALRAFLRYSFCGVWKRLRR